MVGCSTCDAPLKRTATCSTSWSSRDGIVAPRSAFLGELLKKRVDSTFSHGIISSGSEMTNHELRFLPLRDAVRAGKALGNATRLRLLAMLRDGELCGCQLRSVVQLAASTISEHLAELHRCGLLTEQKRGKWVHYQLARDSHLWPVAMVLLDRLRHDPQIEQDAVRAAALRAIPVEDFCRSGFDVEGALGVRVAPDTARDQMRSGGTP